MPSPPDPGVRARVRGLNPGSFALVMATGIVSVAMHNHDLGALSQALLWLAAFEYVVLLVLTGWRLLSFRAAFAADLADPSRAFGFFTVVAATTVLGTRLLMDGHRTSALVLLLVGLATWLVLGYVVPWTAVLGRASRPLLPHVNGTWFIWVVASQAVALLAAVLEPQITTGRGEIALLAVFSWSLGVFLYAAAAVFVSARFLFHELRPTDLTPPYWVSMGATAITVVAGARIVQMADAPVVSATRGLIAGASVGFWVFGTWLIPPLLASGVWRHVVHRVPLRYEAAMWSIVFPLGMYGVGGHFLGRADHLPIVRAIGASWSWFALAAWAVVFVAMLADLTRALRPPVAAGPSLEEGVSACR